MSQILLRRSCRGSYPYLWKGLGSQGVEQCGRSAALVSLLDHQLAFLDQVHEFDPDQRVLSRRKRREPQHGPGHPLDTSMILLHDRVEIFSLPDGDGRAVCLVVTCNRGFIGVTAVDGKDLREPMAADR